MELAALTERLAMGADRSICGDPQFPRGHRYALRANLPDRTNATPWRNVPTFDCAPFRGRLYASITCKRCAATSGDSAYTSCVHLGMSFGEDRLAYSYPARILLRDEAG